ncbi:hypothetical protein SAV14893_024870 [Streptomyces avermitilis]|uniref:Uncharacterized protein n=1 Tax=Streptomyces avermitilis TaxID=33903 RepID=A0A4D4LRF7_STRAX|nr:hypothetical protein SAVMC3_36950 [Streptomyces avermitilis]GDY63094.1 hypothetical protein SAV14893_024870 [Streptomyces avermitilis]GDY76773.1 hypothetical protein SAV31267_062580 [Streptomyces avermitilis]GDY85699.1 hypothetical protein SAVCW2_48980 [Streptomyces avermitilis]
MAVEGHVLRRVGDLTSSQWAGLKRLLVKSIRPGRPPVRRVGSRQTANGGGPGPVLPDVTCPGGKARGTGRDYAL